MHSSRSSKPQRVSPKPRASTPLTENTIHTTWRDLSDHQIRLRGLRLSQATLNQIIPPGPYCYTALGPLPPPKIGMRVRTCIFYRGKSEEDVCLINPDRNYRTDARFNLDQCKGCGINDTDPEGRHVST